MRRARTFVTLLSAAAALVPSVGISEASAQDRKQVGELCLQQHGMYIASFRISIAEANWSGRQHDTGKMAIGRTDCVPLMNTDEKAFVQLDVLLGHTKHCEFSLKDRSGQLTVTASGTTLDVGLACP